METGIPIDFHVHSYASKCGGQSVSQIISEATQKSVSNIGIVDHLNTDNVVSIIKRSKHIPYNNENSPLLGIEADFTSQNDCYIPNDIYSNVNFSVGAIHWIENFTVNFYPETDPKYSSRSLSAQEVANEIFKQIHSINISEVLDAYVPVLEALLNSPKIDIWAHPFRLPIFCVMGIEDILEKLEQHLETIFKALKESNITFELNEGLNWNLKYRTGAFYPQVIQKVSQFYIQCIKYLCKYEIPIALGTDSHRPGGLANYPWIESLLKKSDLSKIILLVREVKK